MSQEFITLLCLFKCVIFYSVITNEISIYNSQITTELNYTNLHKLIDLRQTKNHFLFHRKSIEYSHRVNNYSDKIFEKVLKKIPKPIHKKSILNTLLSKEQPSVFSRSFASIQSIMNLQQQKNQINNILSPIRNTKLSIVNFPASFYRSNIYKPVITSLQNLSDNKSSFNTRLAGHNKPLKSTLNKSVTESTQPYKIMSLYERFARSLDYFERKFYTISFKKLTSICSRERQINGMSFVQSGLLLQLTLMALSLEVDQMTKNEIETAIGFRASNEETIHIIRELISSLPNSTEKLKFRCASQLTIWPGTKLSDNFRIETAKTFRLVIESLNGTEKSEQIIPVLNQQVEKLSGGAIRNTFEEDDVSDGVTAVLTTVLYFRVNWRSPPTVLNDTRPFQDPGGAGSVRMVKLNDVMGYVDLKEWNAQSRESRYVFNMSQCYSAFLFLAATMPSSDLNIYDRKALEIPYSYPDFSLVMIIPRSSSLRQLANNIITTSIMDITCRMRRMRISANLPMYTLRMTLLLPNKLQAMGVSRLFNTSNVRQGESLRLSHMVQRLMFWAEAGRNAYKDDGLEWDEKPEMEILVDRPYIFYVRWRNLTLLNGNFVL